MRPGKTDAVTSNVETLEKPSWHRPNPFDNIRMLEYMQTQNATAFYEYRKPDVHRSEDAPYLVELFRTASYQYWEFGHGEAVKEKDGTVKHHWPCALTCPSVSWNNMCLTCGIPVNKDKAYQERYCCEDCCNSNGVMGYHTTHCCYHDYVKDGMTPRDEIIFRAGLLFRLAAHYSGTLGTLAEVTDPNVCNKIYCTERPLDQTQLFLQKNCRLDRTPDEPDLSTVEPNLGTRARFVFNRSVCRMFNQDWTNELYHKPVAVANLCRKQPWLTNMVQSDTLPAAFAEIGLTGPAHIIAAGAYLGSTLETRDRPLDTCIGLAINIGNERKPYWVNQRFAHVIMSYIKTSLKKPATNEQSRRMYSGDPKSDVVADQNEYCFWQPESDGATAMFSINLWTLIQKSSGTRAPVNPREMKWIVRSEFCPSGHGREREFVYPQVRLTLTMPPHHHAHKLVLGSDLGVPHGEYTHKSKKGISWEQFGADLTKDATYATFYQYYSFSGASTFFAYLQRTDLDCEQIMKFNAKTSIPRGQFGGSTASTTVTAPSAPPTGDVRGKKRALSFPRIHSERTINFSFDLGSSVSQWHAELSRVANSVGDINRSINAADREVLKTYGDLYTNKKGKNRFVRHSVFQFTEPRIVWNRLTTDVNFMHETFVVGADGQHYLKPHIQKAHKKTLKGSVTWSLETMFDIQVRQASRHMPQRLPHTHQVMRSVTEYFDEIRLATNIQSSAFWWTCNSLGFNNAWDYAFNLKGPGIGLVIMNTKPPPLWLAKAMASNPDRVSVRYHGSAPQNALGICRDGLRPTPGAGSDEMQRVWGFDGRGTYVSKDPAVAWTYPQEGQDVHKRHQCGYLIADDGTLPQKLLVTVAVLNEDCMFEKPGQQVYPCDRVHILSLTWLSCEPDRLCVDQQQWVTVYSEVDKVDVKPMLFTATEETGQILYSNLDGVHHDTGKFGEEIESSLPPADDLEYRPAYNDAGRAYDVNQFYLASRIRREFICSMSESEINRFPPFLSEQLSRIKSQGEFYPPSNAEHYEYKTFFVEEFTRDKRPTYVGLSDLDPVKFAQFAATRVQETTSADDFDIDYCTNGTRGLMFLLAVSESLPYADMGSHRLLMHRERHRKTMDIFRSRVECAREANYTTLSHLDVWEIFARASYLGITDQRIWDRSEAPPSEGRVISSSGPKDRFEIPDAASESYKLWKEQNERWSKKKKDSAGNLIRNGIMGYIVITGVPGLENQFKGTFEFPSAAKPNFVDASGWNAIPWKPRLIQPPDGVLPTPQSSMLSECLAVDQSQERRISWYNRVSSSLGLYHPIDPNTLFGLGQRSYHRNGEFVHHEFLQMVHLGSWNRHARSHEPQTDLAASDLTGSGSRFVAVLDPAQQNSDDPTRDARAQCSVCSGCPRLCSCEKSRISFQGGSFIHQYGGIRYDVTSFSASTLLHEQLHESNGYDGNMAAWYPSDSPHAGVPEFLVAHAFYANDAGVSVLQDDYLTCVQDPVFPFSIVASAGFGPLHRCAGRGFSRVKDFVASTMTEGNCHLEDSPLHFQAEIRRVNNRMRYNQACYHDGRWVLYQDSQHTCLAPVDTEGTSPKVLNRQDVHRSELFDAELAACAALLKGHVTEDFTGLYVRTMLTVRDQFRTEVVRQVLKIWNPLSQPYVGYFREIMSSLCRTGRLPENTPYTGGTFLTVMKLPQEGVPLTSGATVDSLPPRAIDFVGGPGPNYNLVRDGVHEDKAEQPDFLIDSEKKVVPKAFAPDLLSLSPELSTELSNRGFICAYDTLGLRYLKHADRPDERIYDSLVSVLGYDFPPSCDQNMTPVSIAKRPFPQQERGTVDLSDLQPQAKRLRIWIPVHSGSDQAVMQPGQTQASQSSNANLSDAVHADGIDSASETPNSPRCFVAPMDSEPGTMEDEAVRAATERSMGIDTEVTRFAALSQDEQLQAYARLLDSVRGRNEGESSAPSPSRVGGTETPMYDRPSIVGMDPHSGNLRIAPSPAASVSTPGSDSSHDVSMHVGPTVDAPPPGDTSLRGHVSDSHSATPIDAPPPSPSLTEAWLRRGATTAPPAATASPDTTAPPAVAAASSSTETRAETVERIAAQVEAHAREQVAVAMAEPHPMPPSQELPDRNF